MVPHSLKLIEALEEVDEQNRELFHFDLVAEVSHLVQRADEALVKTDLSQLVHIATLVARFDQVSDLGVARAVWRGTGVEVFDLKRLQKNLGVAFEERIEVRFDLCRLFLRPREHEVPLVRLEVDDGEVGGHNLVGDFLPEEVRNLHRVFIDDLVPRVQDHLRARGPQQLKHLPEAWTQNDALSWFDQVHQRF